MPVLRGHLPLVGQLTRIVERFFIDDVEHHLWIDIATGGTGAGIGICIVGGILEIGDGINGIAVKHRVATLVEQPQPVEELIHIARRLMDVDDDEFTLERLLLQQEDHLLCIRRREAGSGFVEEQHSWFAYQFQSDVQSFALSSGDVFIDRRAHLQVLDGIEPQVLQRLGHPALDFLIRQALEAQFRCKPEVLAYGEFLDEQIVLRHEADQAFGVGFLDVVAIDGDGALLRLECPVEQRKQCGLSRSGTTHDGQQFPVAERKAQVVHAIVTARESEIDVPPTKLHFLRLMLVLLIGTDDGGVIDRLAVFVFQHAALLPHLIDTGEYGDVVELDDITTIVGEDEQSGLTVEQGLERALEPIHLMEPDTF